MQCKILHKKLIFFLDGDLSEKEAKQVNKHLFECPDCAAFAEYIKKTFNVLQAERSPDVNPFFYTRLKARMEKQSTIPEITVSYPVWEKVLQPVFFSLLLVAGIYIGVKIGQPLRVSIPSAIYADYEMLPYLNEMESEPIETFLME